MSNSSRVSDGLSSNGTEGVILIIPTLRRPDFLARCLESIAAQTKLPAEVLVGIRSDDDESPLILPKFSGRLQVRAVEAKGVGVVGSMNSCLAEAQGKFIGLLDDDIELPSHWLETMLRHLRDCPDILAAAGRDALQDYPAMRRSESRTTDVGRIHWFGRITGNHHRGGGPPRRVDVLRGSNCLFRAEFLQDVGFEEALRGKGAQVAWELALAFQAAKRKRPLFYDPSIEVIHHVAPRLAGDNIHRGHYDREGTRDLAFNETFVIARHGSGFRRVSAVAWQLVIGSPLCPGLFHAAKHILRHSPHQGDRIGATIQGRIEAIRLAATLK